MTTILQCAFAAAAALAALAAADEPAEVVRLKVGTEVVVDVVDFDEAKGIRGKRVDDGALLDITFDQMVPEDARRIRGRRGYLPDEAEPIVVEAMKVRFMTGGEVVGIIVEQGQQTFKLRRGAQTTEYQRSGVRSITPVQVDALEVYDPEELYAQELGRRNPQSPLEHYNLAIWCESLELWTRVKEHLAAATLLDTSFKPEIIDGKLKRATLRLESGEDSDALAKAQRAAARDRFDAALQQIEEFLEKKPGSTLRAEFEKARRVITNQRAKWLKEQVIVHFFNYAERTARQIATEKEVGLKQARNRMEQEGTTMIVEATAKWLKVEPKEVLAQWEDPKRNTASPHYATYGAGTFTLDSVEAVVKGLVAEEEKPEAAAETNAGAAQGDYLEKLKKIIEEKRKAQEAAAKNQGKKKQEKRGPEIADVPPTADEWWAAANTDERTQYLMAWWVDHEPHSKVMKVEARTCAQCLGEGLIRYFDRGGDDKFVPCPRCKSLGIDRALRFH
jgi:hypothetical protein